jgi:MoaA/NifB/PqqE/SkfB family radical SAM enzyme
MEFSDGARLFYGYLRSLYSYYIDELPRPFSASYAITNRCNLRCSYCNYPFLSREELSLEEIQVLFTKLKEMKIVRLGIVGGEPLLRKDIGKVIEIGRALGFYLTMNTNLLLYEKRERDLEGVRLFFTSLDGRKEIHEKNRGKGSFDGVITAISRIRSRGIPVIPICVVTLSNLNEVEFLLALAKELKVKIHFQPQCVDGEITRGFIPSGYNETFRSFWKNLVEEKKRGSPIASSLPYLQWIAQWEDYTVTARFHPNARCSAGIEFLYIDHLGYGYPCPYLKGKVRGIHLLKEDLPPSFSKNLPCSTCIVGPMVEFNLLHSKPIPTLLHIGKSYVF